MKKKYVLIHETEITGEHENGSKSVAEIDENTDIEQYKRELAIEFFELDEEDEKDLVHEGDRFSFPSSADPRYVTYDIREIPKEHFDTLKLYI